VYIYLEGLAEEICSRVFARFPGLQGDILEIVSKCLTEERDVTKEILEDIIDSEQGYLFTNDRIDAYFSLVVRNVRDRVPKTIGFFLVHKCQNKIQFHLYNEINTNKELASSLGEHPAITEERNNLTKRL